MFSGSRGQPKLALVGISKQQVTWNSLVAAILALAAEAAVVRPMLGQASHWPTVVIGEYFCTVSTSRIMPMCTRSHFMQLHVAGV